MRYPLFLLLFVLALAGCDSATTGTSITDEGVDDPFQFGNYWIYQRTDYNSTGAATETTFDTVTVTSGNNGFFVLNNRDSYERVDSGLIFTDGPSNSLWYKFPAQVGDTMSVSSSIFTRAGGRTFRGRFIATVQAVNAPVTVPAGAFLTYNYYYDIVDTAGFTAGRVITYFSPRIGVVKEEYHEVGSSFLPPLQLVYVKELSAYKIR
jgi:hypothetical protein